MTTLFIDIETIPDQRPGALEEIRQTIQAPGNMSKPETIARWMDENADAAADEKWRKTALNGSQGEILCIGYAIDDEPTECIGRTLGASESDMLRNFYDALPDSVTLQTIVGHNVKEFDLRFLFQRSVVNGVRPSLPLYTGSRYPGEHVYDTMMEWSGWGNRISLKNLCAALGIEVKTGDIDGAGVWDAVLAGRYEDIFDYCESDVSATREVWRKMTFQGVA